MKYESLEIVFGRVDLKKKPKLWVNQARWGSKPKNLIFKFNHIILMMQVTLGIENTWKLKKNILIYVFKFLFFLVHFDIF